MATDEEILATLQAKKGFMSDTHYAMLSAIKIGRKIGKQEGKKARDAELLDFLKISRDNNPYPVDIFISVEGKAARNAYTVAIEDIEKFIAESSPPKPEETKKVGK